MKRAKCQKPRIVSNDAGIALVINDLSNLLRYYHFFYASPFGGPFLSAPYLPLPDRQPPTSDTPSQGWPQEVSS